MQKLNIVDFLDCDTVAEVIWALQSMGPSLDLMEAIRVTHTREILSDGSKIELVFIDSKQPG